MDENQIIETLCEKFGIAWEEETKLVPEIIRWGRARSLEFLLLAGDLNMPVEVLLMLVDGNVKNMRKDIQKDIRVDTGAIERVVGRGGDQKN